MDNIQLPLSAAALLILFALLAVIPSVAPIFGLTAMSGTHWLITFGLSLIPTLRAEYGKLWDNFKLTEAEKNRVAQQKVEG